MSSETKSVAVAVTSGVIVALASWAGRRFLEQPAVDHLKDFTVTFIPVWVGLAVYLVVWAFLSIRRVTRGRDDEFKKWLARRERDISDALEAKAERFENYHKAGLEQNKAVAEDFASRYARRLRTLEETWNALDGRLSALERRSGDQP